MTQPKQVVTLAQVGCGYWGPNLLRNFSRQPGCHVKWVIDQRPQRRAWVKENFPRTRTTPDLDVALCDPQVDAIVVATPAGTHYALAKEILQAGKHVFVEKPLAMRTQDADDLVEIASRGGRVLMVGHTFLYNPAITFIKGLLDAGEIGRLYYVYCHRLNLGIVRTDVNAWWNLAPHDVSVLLHLMNGEPPVSISAHGVDYIQSGIEDVVFATLTWPNRVVAHVQVSWLDPGKTRKMTLVGSGKMIVFDDVSDDKVAVIDKGVDRVPLAGENMDYDRLDNYQLFHRSGDVWLPRIGFEEPLKVEAGHFVECVRTGQTPLTGPKHARDVVAILEAGQLALKTHGIVQIQSRD